MSELDKKMRDAEDTMDDYTIHVEITESVGDGGTFYGDHIVVGHPFEDPPDNWEHGQLLFDGNEEGGIWEGEGGGGVHFDGDHVLTGNPNDPPDSLTPNQLLWDGVGGGGGDGNSGPHTHADYLPLTGGTVAGDLAVNGVTTVTGLDARANGSSSPTNPNITFGTSGVNAQTGFYRNSTGAIQVACEGEPVFRFGKAQSLIYNDLQIDGAIAARVGGSAVDPAYGFVDMPGAGMFAHKTNNWLRFAVAGEAQMRIDTEKVTIWKALRVEGTFNPVGGTAFGIADGIDIADVLERAETATMPAVDDEGVATTDAEVDSLTVNEVVTALLAKVKELSAEIEELKGA